MSRSTKGVTTFDCTVAKTGLISEDLEGQVLRRSDALVALLRERYGPAVLVNADWVVYTPGNRKAKGRLAMKLTTQPVQPVNVAAPPSQAPAAVASGGMGDI